MHERGRADDTGPKIKKQPKGVALIIGPWNYPWQCNLIPLVCAIAAGCPAIVKVNLSSTGQLTPCYAVADSVGRLIRLAV